jgi:lipopolysaccharide heptosyltransferase I
MPPADPVRLVSPPLPPNARLLVVRLSALGDVVFALPAMLALRQMLPDAEIDWLVEDRHAALVESLPGIRKVLVFPRRQWRQPGQRHLMLQHLKNLRAQPAYDAVLDFQGNLKSSLQVRLVRSKLRIGFARGVSKEGAAMHYHYRIPDPGRVARCERDLALVRALGWTGATPEVGAWLLPTAAQGQVKADLRSLKLGDQALVLLHTSVTHYGQDKEWPAQCWTDLARNLTAAGHKVLLLWTANDLAQVKQIGQASQTELAPATPSLNHLMALLDQASLTIGTDSGPLHLAALRGNRVLGLFGPTDPVRFAPPGRHVQLIYGLADGQEPPPRDRSRRSPIMEQIESAQVLDSALQLLSQAAGS